MPRAPGRLGFRGRFVHRRERQFHPKWPGALERLGLRLIQQRGQQFHSKRPGALWRHGFGDRLHNFHDWRQSRSKQPGALVAVHRRLKRWHAGQRFEYWWHSERKRSLALVRRRTRGWFLFLWGQWWFFVEPLDTFVAVSGRLKR